MSERPVRSLRQQFARALVTWLLVAIVAAVVIVAAGWQPRVGYLLVLAGLAAVVSVAVQRVGSTMVEVVWPSPFPPTPVVPGVDNRVHALETLLRRGLEDHVVFERRLRPLLEDLAAHRLRRRHGVELEAQPADAQLLLGDEAWTLLTQPTERAVSPARIERAVAAIEHL